MVQSGITRDHIKIGSIAMLALTCGAMAFGAIAIGALAVGAITAGRVKILEARIENLSVGTLLIDHLEIRQSARVF